MLKLSMNSFKNKNHFMGSLKHTFFRNLVQKSYKQIKAAVLLFFLFFYGIFGGFAQCPSVTNTIQSFCDIQTPIVADLVATDNGGGIAWYNTATATTPIPSGFGLINNKTYFLDSTSGNCGSRIGVTVSLYTAPTGQNFQGVCVSEQSLATIASLNATGNNVKWYSSSVGGTPLSTSTQLVSGTIYYAGQTNPNTLCETSRLSVFVMVYVVTAPTGEGVQSFCNILNDPPTVGDLDASGTNNWYFTSTSASVLPPNTPLIDGHVYFGTTFNAPCESTERLQVLVELVPENDAGDNGTYAICETNLATAPPINLFDNLLGTPSNMGVWDGPIATLNGSLGTLNMSNLTELESPYVFTYTVTTSEACPPATATVIVTIETALDSGSDAMVTFCESDSPTDLFELLGGNPDSGGIWTPSLTSGTGIFDPLIDLAGVYTYTLTSTNSCPSDGATVTVLLETNFDAGISGAVSFCQGESSIDLFSILGGTPDLGGTWSPELASGTGVFNPSVDLGGLYTYTLVGTAVCPDATASVSVTVEEQLNAGDDATITFCESDSPVDLFDSLGGNADLGGVWSPSLSSGTGFFDPLNDLAGVYTYTVSSSTAICPQDYANVTVVIEAKLDAGLGGAVTFCENASATDLFTILGGNPDLGGSWSPELTSGTGVFDPAVDLAGSYTYTLLGSAFCPDATAVVEVTVESFLDAGIDGAVTFCENASPTDLFEFIGGNPEEDGIWTPTLTSGTGIFDPLVDLAGVYTYTLISTNTCPSDTATVTVSIVPKLNAGISATVTLCESASSIDLFAILTGSPDLGGTWSPALISGTGFFDPSLDLAGQYTYTIAGSATCPSESSTVTVIITPTLNAGSDGMITFCTDGLSTDLFEYLGNNPDLGGTWSPNLVSGSGIFNPLVDLAGTYTYTLTGSVCPDDSATVNVFIVDNLNAGTDGVITFCENEAPTDLFSILGGTPDLGGIWTPALASGTGVFNPALDLAGIYTYSLIGSTCPSDSATVTVSVVENLNAGLDGMITLCNTEIPTDLFAFLGGTPDLGGSWSPSLASGSGVFNSALDSAGVYTYTLAGSVACPGDSATVTVFIVDNLNAGTDGVITFCENEAPTDLFSILGGTPDLGGIWTPALASGTGIFNPALDSAGIYTYSLIGSNCPSDSATVTVFVVENLNAGTDAMITFCNTEIPTDLFSFLGGTPDLGGSWSPSLASGSGVFNSALDSAGVYTYTLAGSVVCPGDSATVTVFIVENLNAGTDGVITFCENEASTDLFSILGGIPDLGGIWTPALASGTGIFNAALDSAGIYTYSLIGSTCPSDSATVTVSVVENLNAGTDAMITFCNTEIPTDLFSFLGGTPDLGGIWTPALASGTGIFNSALDSAGVYTYTLAGSVACPGDSSTVTVFIVENLNAGTDGVITFCENEAPTDLFSILGGIPDLGGIWTPALASGTGIFNPALDSAGIYTYSLNGSNCPSDSATVTVTVESLPTNTLAFFGLGTICLNSDGIVTISNATNLSNGSYQLTYQISGAIAFTTTISVVFQNGTASFTLPASVLNTVGTSSISISPLQSLTGNSCGISSHFFDAVAFTLEQVETPTFNGTNEFCEADNATISNLTAGISNPETIVWYDAPSNGTAYADTDNLIDGTTYYASLISASGCESLTRLEIKVSVKDCIDPNIVIPDGFSPNGDGINDLFTIKNIRTLYPKFSITIYNRWGNILFEGNASKPDWDGNNDKGMKIGGSHLPIGVYFFILNFNDNIKKDIQGRLYLSR